MINFFKKIIPQKKESLELISIHIPKTAGTSFAQILKDVYGYKSFGSLHIQELKNDQDLRITYENNIIQKTDLNIRTKVLHGHFQHSHISEIIKPPANIPVITWLRNPIDRVVSSYYYADRIYKNELSNSHPRLNILNSLKRNLMEYVHIKGNRDLCSYCLRGIQLEDLEFVGIVEHFEEDMAYLAKKMGWKDYKIPHLNRTSKSHTLSVQKKETISQLNQKDVELYQKALELRKHRK